MINNFEKLLEDCSFNLRFARLESDNIKNLKKTPIYKTLNNTEKNI